MCGERVVIPKSLRNFVLSILHSAHQGVSGMEARAQTLVYWPGISVDIKKTRSECLICCRNAPSQPALLPSEAEIPSTPFESVFADYFDISIYHYLVAGDRLQPIPIEPISSKHNARLQPIPVEPISSKHNARLQPIPIETYFIQTQCKITTHNNRNLFHPNTMPDYNPYQ